jgi:hypothetical protein
VGNNLEAQFVAILGATGCGKTTELKKRLAEKKRRRTFVWSPKEALDNYAKLYSGSVIVRTASEVLNHLGTAGKRGEFHLVFQPTLDQKQDMRLFDIVCKMLLTVGNLTLIVDELHSVTTASNAPNGWRKLNFMGRGFGVHIFGLSQRPASVDKAFMGSLSAIHVGRLPHPPDQKAAAEVLGVDRSEVSALVGFQAIQRDMLTGKIKRLT